MRLGGREGALLVETMVALALGGVLLTALAGVLVTSTRSVRALWERAEALEVVRTVWVALDEELGAGIPGRDWRIDDGGGVVRLRAFRGVARICASDPASGGWTVAARTRRAPEPGRDSLLVLGVDGGWRTFPLEGVFAGGGCAEEAHGERSQRWVWRQAGAPTPLLVRLFERGEYHLADGAFRYRSGAGGRQPLTPERLAPGSGFHSGPAGWEVRLEWTRRTSPPFHWRVAAVGEGPVGVGGAP